MLASNSSIGTILAALLIATMPIWMCVLGIAKLKKQAKDKRDEKRKLELLEEISKKMDKN